MEHAAAVIRATEAFNAAIAAAQAAGVKVRYKKSETQKGGWNGPITIDEIGHILVGGPGDQTWPPKN